MSKYSSQVTGLSAKDLKGKMKAIVGEIQSERSRLEQKLKIDVTWDRSEFEVHRKNLTRMSYVVHEFLKLNQSARDKIRDVVNAISGTEYCQKKYTVTEDVVRAKLRTLYNQKDTDPLIYQTEETDSKTREKTVINHDIKDAELRAALKHLDAAPKFKPFEVAYLVIESSVGDSGGEIAGIDKMSHNKYCTVGGITKKKVPVLMEKAIQDVKRSVQVERIKKYNTEVQPFIDYYITTGSAQRFLESIRKKYIVVDYAPYHRLAAKKWTEIVKKNLIKYYDAAMASDDQIPQFIKAFTAELEQCRYMPYEYEKYHNKTIQLNGKSLSKISLRDIFPRVFDKVGPQEKDLVTPEKFLSYVEQTDTSVSRRERRKSSGGSGTPETNKELRPTCIKKVDGRSDRILFYDSWTYDNTKDDWNHDGCDTMSWSSK